MLCGRDPERRAIGALLDAARDSRSGVLVLRGEVGAGKTALLEDARDQAAALQVLTLRGVESESELAFAGIHQLLRPALSLLERLPGPQARALEAALGLADHAGHDRFLISAACLTLMSELAEQRPVVCLIDDAQWIDTPSAEALLFVARRIDADAIAMIFAAREGDERTFEARGLPSLWVTALDEDAATALIARRVDAEVAPAVRQALVRQAAGNALALVELPAALTPAQLAGTAPLPDALPLTGIQHIFLERVRALPVPAQCLLLVAAAEDTGRLAPIMTAARALGADDETLDAAERSGLVSVRGTQLDFRHPLVRTAVYQSAASGERRAAHSALADALVSTPASEDADRRSWHLAAAAVGPDEPIAAALERAGHNARERSGLTAAASAFARAAGLSVSAEARRQRLFLAADASWQGGDAETGTKLAREALVDCDDPSLRADLMHLLGHIGHFGAPLLPINELLWDAARLVERDDPAKAAVILSDAFEACLYAGRPEAALAAARKARALAPSDGSVVDYLAELNLGEALFMSGLAEEGGPTFAHAVEIFRADPALQSDPLLATRAAIALCWLERCAEARAPMARALETARSRGAVSLLPYSLFIAAWAARRTGAWQDAIVHATEGVALARELGQWATMAQCLQELSTLTAGQGADADCRAQIAEGTAAAQGVGADYITEILRAQLGLLELGLGENERAVDDLRLSAQRLEELGLRLHELVPGPDLVEALTRLGRLDEARAAVGLVRAGANPRTAEALIERCHGLVADDDRFAAHFTRSLALHPDNEDVFGHARTQLAFGERLRRARHRVEAREHLRRALATFQALGAVPWAERAAAELRATGETARKRDESTVAQLTPQELQVARLVGQGLSNKEVAAQLFLSPRTIDAHLRNVFAKLAVTSRTQLARLPLGDPREMSAAMG